MGKVRRHALAARAGGNATDASLSPSSLVSALPLALSLSPRAYTRARARRRVRTFLRGFVSLDERDQTWR